MAFSSPLVYSQQLSMPRPRPQRSPTCFCPKPSPPAPHAWHGMCCHRGLPFSGQRPPNPDVSANCTDAQQQHSKDRPAGMTEDDDAPRPRCQLHSPQSSQTHTRTHTMQLRIKCSNWTKMGCSLLRGSRSCSKKLTPDPDKTQSREELLHAHKDLLFSPTFSASQEW